MILADGEGWEIVEAGIERVIDMRESVCKK